VTLLFLIVAARTVDLVVYSSFSFHSIVIKTIETMIFDGLTLAGLFVIARFIWNRVDF